ncbi:MAG: DUF1360 domain-containing protein [Thermomicrobiales bacterium]
MSTGNHSGDRQERVTKLALIGVFTGLLAVFAPSRKSKTALNISTLDAAMLSLSAFRVGRMTAYDLVAEPLREPFAETIDDPSGAGQTTTSVGEGARKVIGDLLTCPICAGTWASAGMVYGLRLAPGPTRLAMAIFSAAGAAELLNGAVEAMEWSAQHNREKAGE